ncbi:MAG: LysE family translocator [Candidatus Poseidoniales archaeon]|nr:MAG: LysE family translocator [Candidatus Poseidoniales archaeon]
MSQCCALGMEAVAWDILLAAGTVFFLGAISPGPSLMVVLRNTLIGGRRQGVMCAIGHGLGFGVYAGMAVFGLIVLLEEAPEIFTGLQLLGCLLLVWYGWSMWNVEAKHLFDEDQASGRQGFAEGFAIAFFNPKIALFLVAVLAQVLEADMSFASKAAVGLLGMTIDTLWYIIVALMLTGTSRLDVLKSNAQLIHRITALVLWGFALSVFFRI